jgi:hypothetical protein
MVRTRAQTQEMNEETLQQLMTAAATAAVQAAQSRPDQHGNVKGLKDAPHYNGKDDVRVWLRKFDAYGDAVGWSIEDSLRALNIALEGPAADWLWSQESLAHDEDETAAVKLFNRKKGLVERFGQILTSAADYSQMYAVKQGPKDSVDETLERIDAMERRLPKAAPNEVKMFAFISALRPQIRLEVERADPMTLEQALTIARKNENLLLRVYGPRTEPQVKTMMETPPKRQWVTRGMENPRPPMGGAQRQFNQGKPWLPMGGGTPSKVTLPPPMIQRPRLPALIKPQESDDEIEDLRKRFAQIKIGSAEHGEWQRWIMADGRCFRCLEKGHMGRNCPRNSTVRSLAVYEAEEEEYGSEATEEESDPDRA